MRSTTARESQRWHTLGSLCQGMGSPAACERVNSQVDIQHASDAFNPENIKIWLAFSHDS